MNPPSFIPTILGALGFALLVPSAAMAQGPVWKPLGPAPAIDAAADDGKFKNEESGRILSIAIHPTEPKTVYVGTAGGGLYRTLNGGTDWTLIDLPSPAGTIGIGHTQAIGAIAIAPSDPTTVVVGTGQAAPANNTFFGVGIYVIKTADTNPVVTGPFNREDNEAKKDIFTGRSVSAIVIDPTDANRIFVATGDGGFSGKPIFLGPPAGAPKRGLYRTTEGLGAEPKFTNISKRQDEAGTDVASEEALISDMVLEPQPAGGKLTILYVAKGAGDDDGGVFRSTDAAAKEPVFKRTKKLPFSKNGRLAINKVGGAVTVLLATREKPAGGSTEGTVYKSTDGGVTWPGTVEAANGFAGANIGLAIDPNNANVFYLGGSTAGTAMSIRPCTETLDGGATFTPNGDPFTKGLHSDTQVIRVAPSDPSIVYVGCDGGIWKTGKGGKVWKDEPPAWEDLNNATFSATQLNGLAVHPAIRDFIFSGAQDNGAPFMRKLGDKILWSELFGGDGGPALIDSNATATSEVTMYHTYDQSKGSISIERVIVPANLLSATPTAIQKAIEADSTLARRFGVGHTANGIEDTKEVLFYAPIALGPGNPNTVYLGTNVLYRSANKAETMTAVSQALPAIISAIGISPQDDLVRIVGLDKGQVFATTDGSNTMRDVTISDGGAPITAYVSKALIDPNDKNTAYVTFSDFGEKQIWKTANLNAAPPTWTALSTGIPKVPVNALAIDPNDSKNLYAGTDVGVFNSTNAGASWAAYGTGLPRISVFDITMTKMFPLVRIATYGRGVWEIPAAATANAPVAAVGNASASEGVPPPFAGLGSIAAGGSASFAVTLSAPSTQTITFHYETVDGTAIAGQDYTAQSGTVTFMPGETSQTIMISLINDSNPEPTESFSLRLTDATNATLSSDVATGSILSDEAAASMSIDDRSVAEGNSGSANLDFTVTLSPASNQQVTVDYTTADGTTSAGNDYQPVSGTLTFPPGTLTQTISVPIVGDTLPEGDEMFSVKLSNPTGEAVLGKSVGVGTITNDDGAPPYATFSNTNSIAVTDHGVAGVYPAVINVNGVVGTVNKVTVRLIDITHSYPGDLDFLLVGPNGQKVMLMSDAGGSGEIEGVSLTLDDAAARGLPDEDQIVAGSFKPTDYEPGDTFPAPAPAGPYGTALSVFNGTNPNGMWKLFVMDDSRGDVGTVAGGWSLTISTQADPAAPSISIADLRIAEGNAGMSNAVFTARLSAPSAQTVTVDFATTDGTATANNDYAPTSGTLTFPPGSLTKTISVDILGSTDVETDQTFFINLTGAANAVIADNQAMGTIVNDDVIPLISINDLGEPKSVAEGDGGTVEATFTVSLSAASSQEVRVDFATADNSATAGLDYEETSGTLTFAPGETTRTITVLLIGDTSDEAHETFFVNLSNPVNATIGNGQGLGIIIGDEGLQIEGQTGDQIVMEGDDASFMVELEDEDMLTFQWKFNGVPIPGAMSSTLLLPAVKLTDAGRYSVVITGPMDSIESPESTLTVVPRATFAALGGKYQGLIEGDPNLRGTIQLKVRASGAFSGTIRVNGIRRGVRGRFDANGDATVFVGSGASQLVVKLHLELGDNPGIFGSVSNGVSTSEFSADRSASQPAEAGRYTVLLPRNPDHPEAAAPQGDGYGVLTIDGSANLRFVGRLGDGSRVAQGTQLSFDGWWSVYLLTRRNGGAVSGGVEFREVAGRSDLDGTLDWFKPQTPKGPYAVGFTTEIDLEGSRYMNQQPVLNLAPSGFGNVKIENGNLAAPLSEVIMLDANNHVIVTQNNDQFSMSIAPGTGAFSGKFVTPAGEKRTFTGALFQKRNFAAGVFVGVDQAGSVEITPQ